MTDFLINLIKNRIGGEGQLLLPPLSIGIVNFLKLPSLFCEKILFSSLEYVKKFCNISKVHLSLNCWGGVVSVLKIRILLQKISFLFDNEMFESKTIYKYIQRMGCYG